MHCYEKKDWDLLADYAPNVHPRRRITRTHLCRRETVRP
jgi:hypothetical protein